jgi:hypothetical protein
MICEHCGSEHKSKAERAEKARSWLRGSLVYHINDRWASWVLAHLEQEIKDDDRALELYDQMTGGWVSR